MDARIFYFEPDIDAAAIGFIVSRPAIYERSTSPAASIIIIVIAVIPILVTIIPVAISIAVMSRSNQLLAFLNLFCDLRFSHGCGSGD